MPVYTYECRNPQCGERWEEMRSISDPDIDTAREGCRSGGRRVWNPGDMRPVFKGRGWARKDHKDASKP